MSGFRISTPTPLINTLTGESVVNGNLSIQQVSGDFNVQTSDGDNVIRLAQTSGGTGRLQLYNVAMGNKVVFNATTSEDDGLRVSTIDGTTSLLTVNRDATGSGASPTVTISTPLFLSGIPTSGAGLPPGSVYSNAGVLNIA
jgi:hypothetical protein